MILDIDGLKVACGLDWFKTPYGIATIVISLILGIVGAALANHFDKKEEARRFTWHN